MITVGELRDMIEGMDDEAEVKIVLMQHRTNLVGRVDHVSAYSTEQRDAVPNAEDGDQLILGSSCDDGYAPDGWNNEHL